MEGEHEMHLCACRHCYSQPEQQNVLDRLFCTLLVWNIVYVVSVSSISRSGKLWNMQTKHSAPSIISLIKPNVLHWHKRIMSVLSSPTVLFTTIVYFLYTCRCVWVRLPSEVEVCLSRPRTLQMSEIILLVTVVTSPNAGPISVPAVVQTGVEVSPSTPTVMKPWTSPAHLQVYSYFYSAEETLNKMVK